MFAFRSPLSRGALLADEVGLGKTIEAALIISQLWAERKRRILIIVPTTLRKQWAQELAEKFFLPSEILDTRAFNLRRKGGSSNPFLDSKGVVVCSYHFARAQKALIRATAWDLVVVDEAHRLRNVFKPANQIARAIREAIQGRPKVLVTATPLQNSLLELWGLISFLDENTFGDLASFRSQYVSGPLGKAEFEDLRTRLRPLCQRTLRRQVVEYVRYTNRDPITQDFTPTDEEQRLYDLVSTYLQRPELQALPSGQRQLMTLILRRLLAS
jgi:SNF2 family DNA or RNA helicase